MEIIKIREEINKIEIKPKNLFFKKANKIDKPLAKFTKKKGEKMQINKKCKRRNNNQYHGDKKNHTKLKSSFYICLYKCVWMCVYYIILYYTNSILYYIVLYYIILYYIILTHNIYAILHTAFFS